MYPSTARFYTPKIIKKKRKLKMAKYRKKPAVIEAKQGFRHEDHREVKPLSKEKELEMELVNINYFNIIGATDTADIAGMKKQAYEEMIEIIKKDVGKYGYVSNETKQKLRKLICQS